MGDVTAEVLGMGRWKTDRNQLAVGVTVRGACRVLAGGVWVAG